MSDGTPITWRIRSWIVAILCELVERIEVGHAHAILCDCYDGNHGSGDE